MCRAIMWLLLYQNFHDDILARNFWLNVVWNQLCSSTTDGAT
jgi:hypothetical protein